MIRGRVLVIDDEPAMLENCERLLTGAKYKCAVLQNPRRVREVLAQLHPHVLVTDMRMPDVDGMSLLAAALADDPALPVIVITGFATVASAVEAIRHGAFDYIAKPFTAEQLLIAVDRAVRYRGLTLENRDLVARLRGSDRTGGLLGGSPAMLRLTEQIARVAPTDANVLITGESGTGKELVARSIHAQSARSGQPYVPVDCAALPEGLLESELYGHERGAFTGAVARHDGLLFGANHGTVFLDEVGELSGPLQAKLLRTLEQRQLRRVGDARVIDVDIRVLAATNRDVETAVRDGTLREDLYYRLNVVHLQLPPLREREGDLVLLLHAFLEDYARSYGKLAARVRADGWAALERYTWPGNVRELKNLAHRLVVLDDDGVVTAADLPDRLRGVSPGTPNGDAPYPLEYADAQRLALRSFHAEYLPRLLAAHDGKVSKAAATAGVGRRTLHRWLAALRAPSRGTP